MNAVATKYHLGVEELDRITDIDVAFPTAPFLPPMEAIPQEFIAGNTKWNRLFQDWFFIGIKSLKVVPKDGIDPQKALRCLRAHIGSYGPKHEYKDAGVAYMMSLLFEDATWE